MTADHFLPEESIYICPVARSQACATDHAS